MPATRLPSNMLKKLIPLALFSLSVQAASYGNATVKQVTSVYDADTFRVDIEGWPDIIGNRVPIRVNGVDAPELKGKCDFEKKAARVAKQYTVELLSGGKVIELSVVSIFGYWLTCISAETVWQKV